MFHGPKPIGQGGPGVPVDQMNQGTKSDPAPQKCFFQIESQKSMKTIFQSNVSALTNFRVLGLFLGWIPGV